MGVSINVVFDRKVAPFGVISDDHPALGEGMDRLDKALAKAGLTPLGGFVSADPSEWTDMDEDDPEASALPPEEWYPPADGLAAVQAAAEFLRGKPKAVRGAADLLAELTQIEAELSAAAKKKAKFHLQYCD